MEQIKISVKNLGVVALKDLKNYSKDPEELYKLRNEIANLIEE